MPLFDTIQHCITKLCYTFKIEGVIRLFGERLRELRTDRNIRQEEIAQHLGITRQAYGKYESDERQPSYNILVKIADYFNVSLDYLLGRTNIKTPYYIIREIRNGDESEYFDYTMSILRRNVKNLKFIYSLLRLMVDNNKLL